MTNQSEKTLYQIHNLKDLKDTVLQMSIKWPLPTKITNFSPGQGPQNPCYIQGKGDDLKIEINKQYLIKNLKKTLSQIRKKNMTFGQIRQIFQQYLLKNISTILFSTISFIKESQIQNLKIQIKTNKNNQKDQRKQIYDYLTQSVNEQQILKQQLQQLKYLFQRIDIKNFLKKNDCSTYDKFKKIEPIKSCKSKKRLYVAFILQFMKKDPKSSKYLIKHLKQNRKLLKIFLNSRKDKYQQLENTIQNQQQNLRKQEQKFKIFKDYQQKNNLFGLTLEEKSFLRQYVGSDKWQLMIEDITSIKQQYAKKLKTLLQQPYFNHSQVFILGLNHQKIIKKIVEWFQKYQNNFNLNQLYMFLYSKNSSCIICTPRLKFGRDLFRKLFDFYVLNIGKGQQWRTVSQNLKFYQTFSNICRRRYYPYSPGSIIIAAKNINENFKDRIYCYEISELKQNMTVFTYIGVGTSKIFQMDDDDDNEDEDDDEDDQ